MAMCSALRDHWFIVASAFCSGGPRVQMRCYWLELVRWRSLTGVVDSRTSGAANGGARSGQTTRFTTMSPEGAALYLTGTPVC